MKSLNKRKKAARKMERYRMVKFINARMDDALRRILGSVDPMPDFSYAAHLAAREYITSLGLDFDPRKLAVDRTKDGVAACYVYTDWLPGAIHNVWIEGTVEA